MVQIVVGEQEVVQVPQHGGVMGTSAAPRLLVAVFRELISRWSSSPVVREPTLEWSSPISEVKVDVSLCTLADDLIKKQFLSVGTATGAEGILSNSAFVLNEGLQKIRLAQNMNKREVVPKPKPKDELKMLARMLNKAKLGHERLRT